MEANKLSWVKTLLNNSALLKWVKKYSADNLMADNQLANKFGIKTTESSISIGDATIVKLIVTHSKFEGKEIARYSIKQIADILQIAGNEAELIVSAENKNELIIALEDTTIVCCPLPKSDVK